MKAPRPEGRRRLPLTLLLAGLVLTGCTDNSSSPADEQDGNASGMMGGTSGYSASRATCSPPTSLAGTQVRVSLVDKGMTKMMGGDAPMGARMRLISKVSEVPAGQVSFVAANRGWRTHELVVLPLKGGAQVGDRPVGANGRVSEAGDLGEASASCAKDSGEGIESGSAGWTTLTLPRGRYELVCNLRNHYANGMRSLLVVS